MVKAKSVDIAAFCSIQYHIISIRSSGIKITKLDTNLMTDNQREFVVHSLDFAVHPHLLRHTCVTRWFEQGLDIKEIQYLAGHATVDITLEIYTHYMDKERRKETAAKIRAVG